MRLYSLALLGLGQPLIVLAASSSSSTATASFEESTSFAQYLTELPTDTRASYYEGSTRSLLTSTSNQTYTTGYRSNSTTATSTSASTTSHTQTVLAGTVTRSSTSTPSSDVRCNGYNEFCERKYSNVTYVVAHNSPFHIHGNAASNQVYDVTTQLNDGIRGIQSETHYVNDTVMLCHTSCDELNAGTLEAYLTTVRTWLEKDENRLEVITILLGNEDFIDPGNYTAPFTNSGILQYVYTPDSQPMDIDGWPTLGDMILRNKRVVAMLAYDANQDEVPWLLDMWSYQWQTPFSPTNVSFPCTVQRPPGQARNVSENRLYLANHNLNTELDVPSLSIDILIPNVAELDNTNANTTAVGAASRTVNDCTAEWNRPPNYLLVDYYNYGNFNGSALAAAAEANNVTYRKDSCCGSTETTSAATSLTVSGWLSVLLVGATTALMLTI